MIVCDAPIARFSRRIGSVFVEGLQPRSTSVQPFSDRAAAPSTVHAPFAVALYGERACREPAQVADVGRGRQPGAVDEDLVLDPERGAGVGAEDGADHRVARVAQGQRADLVGLDLV